MSSGAIVSRRQIEHVAWSVQCICSSLKTRLALASITGKVTTKQTPSVSTVGFTSVPEGRLSRLTARHLPRSGLSPQPDAPRIHCRSRAVGYGRHSLSERWNPRRLTFSVNMRPPVLHNMAPSTGRLRAFSSTGSLRSSSRSTSFFASPWGPEVSRPPAFRRSSRDAPLRSQDQTRVITVPARVPPPPRRPPRQCAARTFLRRGGSPRSSPRPLPRVAPLVRRVESPRAAASAAAPPDRGVPRVPARRSFASEHAQSGVASRRAHTTYPWPRSAPRDGVLANRRRTGWFRASGSRRGPAACIRGAPGTR